MATNLRLLTMNDVKLVGRLTRDPELRYTTQGTPVCHFSIAVSRSYRDRTSNEWKEEVAFVSCSVWRETAERCGQRLKKGSPVFVEGRLRTKQWQTKEGQKRSDLEVDVLRVQFLEAMGDVRGEATESGSSEDSAAVVADSEAVQRGGNAHEAPVAAAPAYAGSAKAESTPQDDDEVPF